MIDSNNNNERLNTILIVEDDQLMSDLLIDLLSPIYNINLAETVKDALEKSYQVLPDLILCDIKLPDGSGLKILETLKQDELTAHIPIVVISSFHTEEDIIAGLEHGANDYMGKPFLKNELLHRIKTQLENRQRLIDWCRSRMMVQSHDINSELPSKEQKFLEQLRINTEELIKQGELTVEKLAVTMAHSKRHLQRKVKEYLNCSCSDYIYGIRMSYARSLSQKGYSTKEITSMVGYKDVAHFSRIFKQYLEESEGLLDER